VGGEVGIVVMKRAREVPVAGKGLCRPFSQRKTTFRSSGFLAPPGRR
jgi:hypothetical protein